MEFLGVVAFALVLLVWPMRDRMKKLEAKTKKLEKQLDKQRGGKKAMSKLIEALVGQSCRLSPYKDIGANGYYERGKYVVDCEVLDADDEWMKIRYRDKDEQLCVRLVRIDDIEDIALADE